MVRHYFLISVVLISGGLITSGISEVYFRSRESSADLVRLQQEITSAAASKIEQFVQEIERTIRGATKSREITEKGLSPFDRTREINCPIQGHFGAEDKNPSPEDMRKLDAELTKFGKAHEFHTYAGAAHAFCNTGSANYRPHAAALSWPKALEFVSRHLVEAARG